MEWEDLNWTMKDKGEEIFVFFELFCFVVIIGSIILGKVVDLFE